MRVSIILVALLLIVATTLGLSNGGDSLVTGNTARQPSITASEDYPDTWFLSVGGSQSDYPWFGLEIDENGNSYIVGQTSTWEPTGSGALMFLLNSRCGENLRSIVIGTNKSLMARDLVVDNDAVYAVGQVYGIGAGGLDGYIVKFFLNGSVAFLETIGTPSSDLLWGIAKGSDGSLYSVGYTMGIGAGKYDALLVKLGEDGRINWSLAVGGSSYDFGWGIDVFHNQSSSLDEVIVVGQTRSFDVGGGYDALIYKVDGNGLLKWSLVTGSEDADAFYNVAVDKDGYIYAVGYTTNTSSGKSDILVAKISPSGELEWIESIGGNDSETGYGIAVDDSNVYVVGFTNTYIVPGAGEEDAFLVVLDKNDGTLLQAIHFGGVESDIAYSVRVNDKAVFAAGFTYSFSEGSKDFFNIRFSKDYVFDPEPPDLAWTMDDFPENVTVESVFPNITVPLMNTSSVFLQQNYTLPIAITQYFESELVAPSSHVATPTGKPPVEVTTTTVTETSTVTSTITSTKTVTSISTTTITSIINNTITKTITSNVTITKTETHTSTITSTKTTTKTITETITSTKKEVSTTTKTKEVPVTKTVTDIVSLSAASIVMLLVGLGIGFFIPKHK